MNNEQELRSRIMRRVWGIYVLRQVTGFHARFAALAVIFFGIVSSVSVSHVIQNALQMRGIPELLNFSIVALAETKGLVQFFILAAVLLVIWTARDLFRPRHAQSLPV